MTDSKKTTFNIFDTKEIISPDDNTILEEYEAYFFKTAYLGFVGLSIIGVIYYEYNHNGLYHNLLGLFNQAPADIHVNDRAHG